MLEQEYLQLCEQLKNTYEEKEQELNKLKQQNQELKKNLMSCYGFIRIIDYIVDEGDVPFELRTLIDVFRGYLSDMYDDLYF